MANEDTPQAGGQPQWHGGNAPGLAGVYGPLRGRRGQRSAVMTLDTVSILDGSTFVVSDRRGDFDASPTETHGLFMEDTRFLSRWILTVGGIRPKTLSVDEQTYFKVQFFEAVTTGTIYVDAHLSVMRQRCVSGGFEET